MKKLLIIVISVLLVSLSGYAISITGSYAPVTTNTLSPTMSGDLVPTIGIRFSALNSLIGLSTELYINGEDKDIIPPRPFFEFDTFLLLNLNLRFIKVYTGLSPIILVEYNPTASSIYGFLDSFRLAGNMYQDMSFSFVRAHFKAGVEIGSGFILGADIMTVVSDITYFFDPAVHSILRINVYGGIEF